MEYEIGVFLGRMQPIHTAHVKNIRKALQKCNRVVILLGSAQESRTKKNPFSSEERKGMINKIFEDEVKSGRLMIMGIVDMPDLSTSKSWCNHLFGIVKWIIDKDELPKTAIFLGQEKDNDFWYDKDVLSKHNVTAEIVSRNEIAISATELRQAIVDGDYEKFRAFTDPVIHEYYLPMRSILRRRVAWEV